MKIDVYSHAIVVTDVLNDRDTQAMYSFCKPLIEHELKKQGRRMIPTAARTFASATRDRREFHFHRNQLKSLKEHLTRRYGYSEERLNITHHPAHLSDAHKVAFDVIQMHTPRPMQRGIIDYVLDVTDPKYDPIIKMVTLQTGGGKTFIAMYCMLALGVRTVIHFKGGYVDRWKGDLIDTFKFARGELLVVRGAKDMIAIQQMALNNELHAKCIIITSGTMREYIRDYEQSNGCSRDYPIKPMDFYPKLGVGFRITDELHQEFHNNYKIDLYTHVPRSLGLSATMVSSNPFKNKMYEIAYPTHQRHDGGGYNVYIGVTAVMYHIDPDVKMTYQGAQGYSHVLFEGSLMRHRGILKSYFKIIETTFYNRFYQDREPGQKALIFFARVDMCTAFKEYLEAKYADLEIVRYVGSENDPYEDLLAADVGVTTVGSGGTAIDIPNLRCSLMTTAMDSRQANEQVLGRTRPLKDWPDVTPEFIYFNCVDIDQHMKYHNNKKHTFNNKVVYHAEINSRHMVSLPAWNKK